MRKTPVDQATIRGIVSRLRQEPDRATVDPKDARTVINSLTPANASLLKKMIRSARRIREMALKNLNPVERTALMYILRSMTDSED